MGIPVWPKPVPGVPIHCDSQAAIIRAKNNSYNGKTRYIRQRHNTVRQRLKRGIITIDYVKSASNLADPLTKGLTKELILSTSRGMGLKPTHDHLWQMPYLNDWRSQELGFEGENRVIWVIWGYYTRVSNSCPSLWCSSTIYTVERMRLSLT